MNRKLPPAEEERKSGLEERYQKAHLVMDEVRKSIVGKDDCIEKVMAAILAGGNVLLEDVPGVGKTEMAIAFSIQIGRAHV